MVLGQKHGYTTKGGVVAMRHDMSDHVLHPCELYGSLAGNKLKAIATPFVAEGSLIGVNRGIIRFYVQGPHEMSQT